MLGLSLLTLSILPVVRAFDLPKTSKLVKVKSRTEDGRFYAILSVDGKREKTKIADPGSAPEWNEIFFL